MFTARLGVARVSTLYHQVNPVQFDAINPYGVLTHANVAMLRGIEGENHFTNDSGTFPG